jgi:hypothetical protein
VEIKVTETQDHRDYHISSDRILKDLGYQAVSSIRQEVARLRAVLDSGKFPDIDAAEHYNMKFMKIARDAGCMNYLAHP